MAKLENLAPLLLKWEERFVNDPADLGGTIKKGVTFIKKYLGMFATGIGMSRIAPVLPLLNSENCRTMSERKKLFCSLSLQRELSISRKLLYTTHGN